MGEESAAGQRLMETLRGDYRVKEEALFQSHVFLPPVLFPLPSGPILPPASEWFLPLRDEELVASEKLWKEKQDLLTEELIKKEKITEDLNQAEAEYKEKLAVNRKKLGQSGLPFHIFISQCIVFIFVTGKHTPYGRHL